MMNSKMFFAWIWYNLSTCRHSFRYLRIPS